MNMSINDSPIPGSSAATPALFLTPRGVFEGEKLPFPPVPAQLASSLHQQRRTVFATRPLPANAYHLNPFLAEVAADPAMPAYAVVALDGHGLNCWAAHYYLVSDAIALFIQLPWGGAYVDPDAARAEIADVFDWAAELQSRVQACHDAGKIPPGWRLQVAASRLGQAGWRWLVAGRDNTTAPWKPAAGMKATILQTLDDLLAGKHVLSEESQTS